MKDLSILIRNVDDMKVYTGIPFTLVCIAAILCAGCTGSAPAGTPATPVSSPAVTEVPVTTVTTIAENVTAATTAKVTATIPAKNADPILHRYVFRWPDPVKETYYGYEYKFFSDGSVIYKYGPITEVSSNLKINPTSQMGGTWTNMGNKKYQVKVVPEGKNVQSYTREYTLVLAYEDPAFPGKLYAEHIESDYERNAIYPGLDKLDRTYFPERAKID
jgi:hypothetical protein